MKLKAELSNSLKKEDLKAGPIRVTIDRVTKENYGDDEKVTLHFTDSAVPPMAMNKTNLIRMIELFCSNSEDPDSDDFVGQKIEIYADPNVMYKGARVGGLAVRGIKGQDKAEPGGGKNGKRASDPI